MKLHYKMLLVWHLGISADRILKFLEYCESIEEDRWRLIDESCALNEQNEQRENWVAKVLLAYCLGSIADQAKVLANNFELPFSSDNIRYGLFYAMLELAMWDFEQTPYFIRKFRYEVGR